ncbi:hypothetical protein KEM48_013856 [Puccinia striiformis f. sp. tritici PST-130]|nr:hypothetical protein KEM48_013856 [Puccinia striiformis f. sp. tritici PST-130]
MSSSTPTPAQQQRAVPSCHHPQHPPARASPTSPAHPLARPLPPPSPSSWQTASTSLRIYRSISSRNLICRQQGCLKIGLTLPELSRDQSTAQESARLRGGALDNRNQEPNAYSMVNSPTDPNAPHSKHTSNPLDPTHYLHYLLADLVEPQTFESALVSPRGFKGCQKSAAHFIMALKTELGWGTEIDEIQENGLMVNMLYDVNTNATVKVISNVLRLLHLLKALGVLLPPSEDELVPQGTNVAMDDRARVVKEILESERKYVQDLEVLQNYQRALLQREILPSDQIRALSSTSTLSSTFRDSLAQDENAALTKVADILDPTTNAHVSDQASPKNLQISFAPPATGQNTTPGGPYYDELKEGLASITRVTDAVNENHSTTRERLAVNDLKERVEDWKGHDLVTFGALVLEDTFTVVKNDSEREYHVYLFERIILCCKEVGIKLDKKASKQSMSLKKNSQINNSNANGGNEKTLNNSKAEYLSPTS